MSLVQKDLRVGVLMGGLSPERDVSLTSGRAVADALRERGWDVVEVDVGTDLPERLHESGVEVAWIALHGIYGEDGCVQGLLEIMRIPYTGSGPTASAVCMDKHLTKAVLAGSGIDLLPHRLLDPGDPLPPDLRFPVVVKAARGGSSLGTAICRAPEALEDCVADVRRFGDRLLLEEYRAGQEITVALLEGRALPVVEIRPVEGFFDFEAKYTKGRTRYVVPAEIPEAAAGRARQAAHRAGQILNVTGVARADFILDDQGVPWFLEVNTIPGLTTTSLSPMAAAAVGLSFADLVEEVLAGARLHRPPGAPSA